MEEENHPPAPFEDLCSLPVHDLLLGFDGAYFDSNARVNFPVSRRASLEQNFIRPHSHNQIALGMSGGMAPPQLRPSGPALLAALRQDVEDVLLLAISSPKEFTLDTFKTIWKQVDFGLIYSLGFTMLPTSSLIDAVFRCVFDNLRTCMDIQMFVERKFDACVYFLFCLYQAQPVETDERGQKCALPYPIYIAPDLYTFLITALRQTRQGSDAGKCLRILFRKHAFVPELGTLAQVFKPRNFPFDPQDAVRDLQLQLAKIEEAMVRDCVPALHFHELQTISDRYDSLRLEYPRVPFLSGTNFPWTIRSTLAKGNQPIPSIPALRMPTATGGRRRNTVMGSLESTPGDQSKRRKSTNAPHRPGTAPPHMTPSSDRSTPPPPLEDAMDMPDLANFLAT